MRAVDIFSGCGGMSLGFEQVGVDVVGSLLLKYTKRILSIRFYKKTFVMKILFS